MASSAELLRGLEFHSDHRPIVATIALKSNRQPLGTLRNYNYQYNIRALRNPAVDQAFKLTVHDHFTELNGSDDSGWVEFRCYSETLRHEARHCEGVDQC